MKQSEMASLSNYSCHNRIKNVQIDQQIKEIRIKQLNVTLSVGDTKVRETLYSFQLSFFL